MLDLILVRSVSDDVSHSGDGRVCLQSGDWGDCMCKYNPNNLTPYILPGTAFVRAVSVPGQEESVCLTSSGALTENEREVLKTL